MATATKVRKTKDGSGTIYKLEPALVVENGEVEYIIYSYIPKRDPYEGFLVFPEVTTLVACVPSENGFAKKFGLLARQYEHKKLNARQALKFIGYTVS